MDNLIDLEMTFTGAIDELTMHAIMQYVGGSAYNFKDGEREGVFFHYPTLCNYKVEIKKLFNLSYNFDVLIKNGTAYITVPSKE